MYLQSSLEFLCLAWRNDAVWFLYLVLKSFSVSPMYISVHLEPRRQQHQALYFLVHPLISLAVQQLKQKMSSLL